MGPSPRGPANLRPQLPWVLFDRPPIGEAPLGTPPPYHTLPPLVAFALALPFAAAACVLHGAVGVQARRDADATTWVDDLRVSATARQLTATAISPELF